MWGIAMSGADICGFLDESAYAAGGPDAKLPDLPDAEYQQLCNRWVFWVLGCGCVGGGVRVLGVGGC